MLVFALTPDWLRLTVCDFGNLVLRVLLLLRESRDDPGWPKILAPAQSVEDFSNIFVQLLLSFQLNKCLEIGHFWFIHSMLLYGYDLKCTSSFVN